MVILAELERQLRLPSSNDKLDFVGSPEQLEADIHPGLWPLLQMKPVIDMKGPLRGNFGSWELCDESQIGGLSFV